jgi:glyoxylase-like metal-dependent hydrolase (beta-lactamase superfamily II)/ferredoxin
MAERTRTVAENAAGDFFVDLTCIDCDTCRQLAPATFADAGEHSYVRMQPRDREEHQAALRALLSCPTASIGTSDKRGISAAVADFPLQLEANVYYCGFNSHKSYGGNSYFVEHPAGNLLIDSPRYVESLARRFEERGGVRHIFLTHRDDVAEAAKWGSRFGAARIIHKFELAAQPAAECVFEGYHPRELAEGFLVIPTPGHTRGHMVLLYQSRYLFSGDHFAWDRESGRLCASRDYCWYSWREQLDSLVKLQEYSFEWVLPGHGQRVHLPAIEMHRQMMQLVAKCNPC